MCEPSFHLFAYLWECWVSTGYESLICTIEKALFSLMVRQFISANLFKNVKVAFANAFRVNNNFAMAVA